MFYSLILDIFKFIYFVRQLCHRFIVGRVAVDPWSTGRARRVHTPGDNLIPGMTPGTAHAHIYKFISSHTVLVLNAFLVLKQYIKCILNYDTNTVLAVSKCDLYVVVFVLVFHYKVDKIHTHFTHIQNVQK